MIKKLTPQQMYKKYRSLYSNDQEGFYSNLFIKIIFDFGHRYIASKVKKLPGVILDIGSGMGYHLKFEDKERFSNYICLDVDHKIMDKIKYPEIKKLISSSEKINLPSESVDIVITSHVLEHIPNLIKSLKEIDRVLKKNGHLIVVLPCDPGFLWDSLTQFSPSRRRLKKIGLDYDTIMNFEHVNNFNSCVSKLNSQFIIEESQYFPTLIPTHHLNLICGLKLRKR